MTIVYWMTALALACFIAGVLVGANNPTKAAAAKKIAAQAKDATLAAVDKLKS